MTEVAFAAGLRQHSPFQRDVPAVVRPLAARIAPTTAAANFGGGCRRARSAAALSAAVRLGRDDRRSCGSARLPASSMSAATLTRARSNSTACTGTVTRRAGGRQRAARAPCVSPNVSALPDHHRAAAPRVRSRRRSAALSPRISPRIRRSRRSSQRARACACPAPGTASNWRCVPCLASRSRSSRLRGSPAAWSRPIGEPLSSPGDSTLTHVFPRPGRSLPPPISLRSACRAPGGSAVGGRAAAVADPHLFDANRGARRRGRHGCAPSAASASGRRNTSRFGSCASPTRFPPPTSGFCARSPAAMAVSIPRRSFLTAPTLGDRGAPTPRNICGRRREVKSVAQMSVREIWEQSLTGLVVPASRSAHAGYDFSRSTGRSGREPHSAHEPS